MTNCPRRGRRSRTRWPKPAAASMGTGTRRGDRKRTDASGGGTEVAPRGKLGGAGRAKVDSMYPESQCGFCARREREGMVFALR